MGLVGLGWLGWVEIFSFMVGLVWSWVKNIFKILKLGRPIYNLIVINTDK